MSGGRPPDIFGEDETMTSRHWQTSFLTALIAAASFVSQASAIEIGRDDFNGFTAADNIGAGLVGTDPVGASVNFLTRSFSPDNSANLSVGFQPGAFPSSGFDLFGLTNRDVMYDVADDSLTFTSDDLGIADSTFTGGYLVVSDTENNDNSGAVSAQWDFDVTGYSNLTVSLDMAAIGDFEAPDDFFVLKASFDGGATTQTIMTATANEGVYYGVNMEGGAAYNTYYNTFFDEATWNAWALTGFCAPRYRAGRGWFPQPGRRRRYRQRRLHQLRHPGRAPGEGLPGKLRGWVGYRRQGTPTGTRCR